MTIIYSLLPKPSFECDIFALWPHKLLPTSRIIALQ